MTQHKWYTTDDSPAYVLTGWDRPLQYFFLDITQSCGACSGEGISAEDDEEVCENCDGESEKRIFGNLENAPYRQRVGRMTLAEVATELDRHLTAWPKDLLTNLAEDCARDAGNEVAHYAPVGTLK